MARKSLPQQRVLGDFLEPKKPSKPKLPPGVFEKKIYDISLADSQRTGQRRKLSRTDWYVRIRFREYPRGPRIPVWRKFEKNTTDAKDVLASLKSELQTHGPKTLKHARMTWTDLSKHFREHYLPGYSSPKAIIVSLNALEQFFGARPIRSITRGDLKTFKRVRLATPVVKSLAEKCKRRTPQEVAEGET